MDTSIASRTRPPSASHRAAVVSGSGTVHIDGDASLLASPGVAIIGSRRASPEGCTLAALQARIAREHLVVSPFAVGTPMAGWHFPRRNCLMARIAASTVLVEAAPKSGTRHQVEACIALGRPILVHASRLGCGIDGLDVAHSRGPLRGWREPREALPLLPEALAERRTSRG